ncbi:DNA primase family protein [Rhodoplanes sp. Z2-YC6860]|uniref:DNA primase family protein n=1 Tax=Rhodoplanes sp. Z2-YC6860 TaxID=674703 RepID=UPI0012ECD6F8|nr:phage/plasmid primase, P4 family [Rhodoplanes sp. Z2-YC6860]
MARLRAIRMLRTSEAEKDAVLAESFIKLATSNEPILVRELNQPFFELRPQFKLFISGNYKPRIRGTDDGIWRRIILVPWLVKVSDEMCDPHLADKLKAEASGILNRMLEGVVDWMKGGLQVPPPIAEATAEYRSDSDHLGRFKAECLREVPGSRVASADIYDVFVAWAKSTGAPIWTRTGFGRAMTDRGSKSTKSGSNYWIGIELTRQLSDFGSADEPPVDDQTPPTATDDVPIEH